VELGYKSNGPGPEIKKKREMQCYDYKIMSGASEREKEMGSSLFVGGSNSLHSDVAHRSP
jgi:hypothetical protein